MKVPLDKTASAFFLKEEITARVDETKACGPHAPTMRCCSMKEGVAAADKCFLRMIRLEEREKKEKQLF
jgi:hypothetical protein